MKPSLSIIIPTYEQHGFGAGHLMQCLQSIAMQDYTDPLEVIITDNSDSPAIKTIVSIFQGQLKDAGKSMNIMYVKNPDKGAATNANRALDTATGDYIKPLFMDDAFITPDALKKFAGCLEDSPWCFSDSIHKDEFFHNEKPFNARMDIPLLLTGCNPIGMPSVIAFRKTELRFDTELNTLFDVEFYLQLYGKYGPPVHLMEPVIVQRVHPHSLSANQTPRLQWESQRMREKLKPYMR